MTECGCAVQVSKKEQLLDEGVFYSVPETFIDALDFKTPLLGPITLDSDSERKTIVIILFL